MKSQLALAIVVSADKDRKTLFGIAFYGGWGTPSARNLIVAIPASAQGYTGRAKQLPGA